MKVSLGESVTAAGREYRVRTDFRVILEILAMLQDPELTDGDKAEAMLQMFYIEIPEDRKAALEACRDFICPPTLPGGRGLVDWERDFDLMIGPVNRVLGTECRELERLHWRTFLSAYMEISGDCLYGQVLRIREKLRSGKKLEKYERDFWRRNRLLIQPPTKTSGAEERILDAWTKGQ